MLYGSWVVERQESENSENGYNVFFWRSTVLSAPCFVQGLLTKLLVESWKGEQKRQIDTSEM